MITVSDIINENLIEELIVKTWRYNNNSGFEIADTYYDEWDIPNEVYELEVTSIYSGNNGAVVIEAEIPNV